ncbi:MAG: hypothetical protein HETSPECPRED_005107 [Heterodermia speciosa]|uniref:Methyltransferase domain-containing protein n=1 Tax=Heterodermia speciosa TaxID=116794 RepID=A0A8H3FC90_9LECA|nr:MAG: hypothetical protein HETSPECPRED_005107 [Heterodermia speciosa]
MASGTPTAPAGPAAPALPAVDNSRYGIDNEPGDSAYDSEVASYTTSLATNITDYKIENGRRYHAYKEGSRSPSTSIAKDLANSNGLGYPYPNDEKENDRLDIVHKMTTVMLHDRLHLSPIAKDPQRILDLGTGTGIWAMDMGDKYPNAEILGNDLSPIQPRWVPPNVRFEVDDVEADWTYTKPFDFIHCRYMSNAISDWPRLGKQCFDHTKAGGYTELIDFDLDWTSPDGSIDNRPIQKLNRDFLDGSLAVGKDPSPGPKLEQYMKAAGFEDVYAEKFIVPVGTWPADKHLKEVGAWNYLQVMEGIEGFLYRLFTNKLGYSSSEVELMCVKIRADMKDPKMHAMMFVHVAYGKKPEEKSAPED